MVNAASYACRFFKILVSITKHSEDKYYEGDFEPGAAVDGAKFISLDNLYEDLKNERCVIYSFGLSDDWTFEEYMANFGCKVTFV